jgi:hypothetical protein
MDCKVGFLDGDHTDFKTYFIFFHDKINPPAKIKKSPTLAGRDASQMTLLGICLARLPCGGYKQNMAEGLISLGHTQRNLSSSANAMRKT